MSLPASLQPLRIGLLTDVDVHRLVVFDTLPGSAGIAMDTLTRSNQKSAPAKGFQPACTGNGNDRHWKQRFAPRNESGHPPALPPGRLPEGAFQRGWRGVNGNCRRFRRR